MRATLTRVIVLAGLILAAMSFALALPLRIPGVTVFATAPAGSDGAVPYLPALFILGIMLVFLAAVVYELLPDRSPPPWPPAGAGRRR
ncbi:MAG TPA: hypothetical protein VNN19_09170 [bacterium]|nr:hypothetical protein [bacterium]